MPERHLDAEFVRLSAAYDTLRDHVDDRAAEFVRLSAAYDTLRDHVDDRAAELVRLSAAYDTLRDHVVTVADEAFGPFPVQTAEEALTAIERGIFELRGRLLVAERKAAAAAPGTTIGADLALLIAEWDGSSAHDWPLTRRVRYLFRAVAEGRRAKETLAKAKRAQARRVVKTAKGATTIDATAVIAALRSLARTGTKGATAAEICEQLGVGRGKRGWSKRSWLAHELVGRALQRLKRDGTVTLRAKRWSLVRGRR